VAAAVAATVPQQTMSVQEARSAAVANAIAGANDARQTALAEAGRAVSEARAAVRAQTPSNREIDALIEMKAVGVTPEYVKPLRRSGYVIHDPDKLVELWAVGFGSHDFGAGQFAPPRPPKPPKPPPANWDPVNDPDNDDDGGG